MLSDSSIKQYLVCRHRTPFRVRCQLTVHFWLPALSSLSTHAISIRAWQLGDFRASIPTVNFEFCEPFGAAVDLPSLAA